MFAHYPESSSPSPSDIQFTPPIQHIEVVSRDERNTSCSLMIRDAMSQQFSLLVQTQDRFTGEVIAEPFVTDPTVEPVFMVPSGQLDEQTLETVLYGTAPELLRSYLVPQIEEATD